MKRLQLFIACISLLVSGLACAKPTLEDFLKEKDFINVVISPNGRYLAKLWNRGNERIVSITDLAAPDQPVVGYTADKVVRARSISWANNERLLVNIAVPYNTDAVIRDSEKKKDFDIDDYYMFSRMVSMDVNAKNSVVLLEDQRSLRGNINLSSINNYLPHDNQHILMSAYRGETISLFKVNVYTGKSEPVVRGTRFTFHFVSNEDGVPRYRFDYKPVAKTMELYEYRGEEVWEKIDALKLDDIQQQKDFDLDDLVGIYENDLVYRKKNESTGYYELVKFKAKEKKIETFISAPDKDILFPLADLRSNKVVGYVVDGDLTRHKYFDPEDQKKYDQIAQKVGEYNFTIGSSTEARDKYIIKTSGPDDPLSFNLYDVKADEMKFLHHSYANISTKHLSYPARAFYLTRDSKKLRAYMLLPADYEPGKRYPLIVMPHGGPHARDHADYDDFAQFLSTRGYIVIKPNFRGSIGYGKEFEEAGYKQWGLAMQDDLDDAVGFMVKKGYADPQKVCMVGISYGGYAALMAAVKRPDLYRCNVSINGVTHLRDMMAYDTKALDDDELVEKYIYRRIGNPDTDKAMLDENSPAVQAEKIKTPLLVIASTADETVPIAQAKTLVSALKKYKKDYKYITLENSGHNPFYYREDMEKVYREVDEFLAKYLASPPTPAVQ
jgi:esterase/lipase